MSKRPIGIPASDIAKVDPTTATAATPVSTRRELTGRLANLSLPRQVAILAVWPFLEQLLNFAIGTVDVMLAGRLSPESLAVSASNAFGIAGYVGWLVGLLHGAVGVGSTALISRAIGGRRRGLANAALAQSMLLALAMGLFSMGLLRFGAESIGRLVGGDAQTLELSTIYLRILALATPASAVLFVGAACLRGAGDTRTPFFIMLAVNVVNVLASTTLVYAPAPLGGHGVAGIAIGTTVAWYVGALLVVYFLLRGRGGIRLYRHRLRPHLHTLKRIVRVGLPNLVESLGLWSGNFLVLRIVAATGSAAALGAHVIAIRVEAVSFLPGFAMGIAAATLVGQYLGLGDRHRAKQAAWLCWAMGAGFMTCVGLAFIIFPEFLIGLITDAGAILDLSPHLLRLAGFVQFFFGSAMVFSFALRGAGDTRAAMVLTYFCTFAVRLPAAWLLGVHLGLGLMGVWYALCGELVVRGLVFAGRFLQGAWQNARV